MFIPRWYGDTADARYEIYAADGRHNVSVRQIDYNDQWVSLGTYPFSLGDGGYLRLADVTSDARINIGGRTRRWIAFDTAQWVRR